jgi:CBS domain-containing protein
MEKTIDRPKLARDIMVTRLVTVHPRTHVFDGIAALLRHRITGAPVIGDHHRYLGMLSEKSCLAVLTVTARAADERGLAASRRSRSRDFMARRLVTLRAGMPALDAIALLLKNRISGAPVVDSAGRFLGVFSEKFSMDVLLGLAYDQLPAAPVDAFMNTDFGRVIEGSEPLIEIAQRFLDTPYRRLPVVRDGALVGQVSRRDVLAAEHHLTSALDGRRSILRERSSELGLEDLAAPDEEGESADFELDSTDAAAFMDRKARTISEDTDLLTIARIFKSTPYRRLPVLRGRRLVGQISRRDVLEATHGLLVKAPQPGQALLYLSAVVDAGDRPSLS